MPISSTSQHVNVCIVVLFTAPYTGYNLQTSIFRKPSCMSNSALQKDTDSQQKQEQSNSLRAGLIQAWPSPNQFWRPLYSDSDSGSNMSFRTLLCRTLTEKAPSRWRNSSLTMLYVSMSPDNTVLCSAPIQNQSRCEYDVGHTIVKLHDHSLTIFVSNPTYEIHRVSKNCHLYCLNSSVKSKPISTIFGRHMISVVLNLPTAPEKSSHDLVKSRTSFRLQLVTGI